MPVSRIDRARLFYMLAHKKPDVSTSQSPRASNVFVDLYLLGSEAQLRQHPQTYEKHIIL